MADGAYVGSQLVIAVKVMERQTSCDAGATRDDKEKEQDNVSLVMYVVDVRGGGRREEENVMVVKRRIIVTSRAAYSSKGLFGEADENTQEECVICLTDPKDTALLPCRHCELAFLLPLTSLSSLPALMSMLSSLYALMSMLSSLSMLCASHSALCTLHHVAPYTLLTRLSTLHTVH